MIREHERKSQKRQKKKKKKLKCNDEDRYKNARVSLLKSELSAYLVITAKPSASNCDSGKNDVTYDFPFKFSNVDVHLCLTKYREKKNNGKAAAKISSTRKKNART